MTAYEAAWDEAVAGVRPQPGLDLPADRAGRGPGRLVAGAARLIERGVYPFVVPFRPLAGTLARRDGFRRAAAVAGPRRHRRVAELLRAAGMTGADQQAGCAACGACSVLQAAGG